MGSFTVGWRLAVLLLAAVLLLLLEVRGKQPMQEEAIQVRRNVWVTQDHSPDFVRDGVFQLRHSRLEGFVRREVDDAPEQRAHAFPPHLDRNGGRDEFFRQFLARLLRHRGAP